MHETVPQLVQGPEQEEARGAHRVAVLHCMSNPPDKLPIVVIWTEPEARCGDGCEGEFEACVTPRQPPIVLQPGFSGRPSESGGLLGGIARDAAAGCARSLQSTGLAVSESRGAL